jgi:hypothetical protein
MIAKLSGGDYHGFLSLIRKPAPVTAMELD